MTKLQRLLPLRPQSPKAAFDFDQASVALLASFQRRATSLAKRPHHRQTEQRDPPKLGGLSLAT